MQFAGNDQWLRTVLCNRRQRIEYWSLFNQSPATGKQGCLPLVQLRQPELTINLPADKAGRMGNQL
jgi:hypothetical protein